MLNTKVGRDRTIIVFCVLVAALVYVQLRFVNVIPAIAQSQPDAGFTVNGTSRCIPTESVCTANQFSNSLESDFLARPYALLSRGVILAGFVGFFFAFLLWSSREALHRIHIIFLHAHESFPLLLPDQRNSRHEKTYVVRLLTVGAIHRYMSCAETAHTVNYNKSPRLTSHQQRFQRECRRLIRHRMVSKLPALNEDSSAISLRDIGEATRFTCMLHRDLLVCYFLLLLSAILLPSLSWTAPVDKTQFPLIMAGIGFVWTSIAVYLHAHKIEQLELWDRQQLGFPFDGAPVFEAVSEAPGIVRGERHYWQHIPPAEFTQPAKIFGLDHLTVQQLALVGLFVAYLAVLSLIK